MAIDSARLESLFGLNGKVAVVTGGSRGIGYMIAEGLLDAGCRVIISARKVEPVVAAADALSARGECTAIPGDLSTPEGVEAFSVAVLEHEPAIDILVNNAGASWGAPLSEFPVVGWDKVMDTNVRSVFFLTQALLGALKVNATADAPSRVINIGSVDGLRVPAMDTFSYSASKAAVHMLTRHLAKELAPSNVLVNAIAPGPFDSKMMAFVLDDPAARAEVASSIPLGRIGQPDDMAGAALFLASRASSYVTGTVLPVGGGVATVE